MGITGVNKEKNRQRENEMAQKLGQESVKETMRCGSENRS